jgi:hypothetical protein
MLPTIIPTPDKERNHKAMIFQRISPFTGKLNQMDLPVTEDQVNKYNNGALIQDAFPNLNASQREFLKTGLTDDDWDNMFPPDDGEEQEETLESIIKRNGEY